MSKKARVQTEVKRLNDNDNVNVSLKHNYNDNVINDIDNDRYKKGRSVETIADRLIEKLSATDKSRPFFCKVAYKLPESRIWEHCEAALSPKCRNPMGLFIYLCKRDGV